TLRTTPVQSLARGWPRTGRPNGRVSGSAAGEQPGNDALARREHVVYLLGLLAARFREIGAAPATPTDNRRNFLDDLASLDAAGEVGRHRDDDLYLAIGRRREHDDAALDFGLQRVGQT